MFHDTHVHSWVSPSRSHAVTGTWADAAGAVGNTIVRKKSANAETGVLTVPVNVPMNDGQERGAYLVSLDLYYELLTAAATSVTPVIYKVTLPANGDAIGAPESLAFSYDAGSDAVNERNTQDQHAMTLTLTTPVWVEDDHVIQVQVSFVCGAAVVVDWIGLRANYTYRL
ncbi:MAG: hypothetical protein A2Z04_01580 [Chloroflexi bacterium RBG_16_57_9]|nr:MAG: hypothetical protein A2Z04_01580 [Chloroflexi bacterium RBG_16_57_9]